MFMKKQRAAREEETEPRGAIARAGTMSSADVGGR
jgi:hypothetical protein